MRPVGAFLLRNTYERISQLAFDIGQYLNELIRILNGNVSFGDGTSNDNIKGIWVNFTSNGTGGTETTITHNLGVIPTGVLVMVPPASGTWNRGSTPWTETELFLTFSAASQTVRVFVLIL